MAKAYKPTGVIAEFDSDELELLKQAMFTLENMEVQLMRQDREYDSEDVNYINFKCSDAAAGGCLAEILKDFQIIFGEINEY